MELVKVTIQIKKEVKDRLDAFKSRSGRYKTYGEAVTELLERNREPEVFIWKKDTNAD